MLAADFLRMEIPQQPIVVGHEPVELAVPFFWQPMVEFCEKGQQWALRGEVFLVTINRNFGGPAEPLPERSETEAVEEILTADEREVPEARDAARIFFDRNFPFELLEQMAAFRMLLQMKAQLVQGRKKDGRTDEIGR